VGTKWGNFLRMNGKRPARSARRHAQAHRASSLLPSPLQTGIIQASEDTEVASLSLTVKDMAAIVQALSTASGMPIEAVIANMSSSGGGGGAANVSGEKTGLLAAGGGAGGKSTLAIGGSSAAGGGGGGGGGGAGGGGVWDAVATALMSSSLGAGGNSGGAAERMSVLRGKMSGAGAALATLVDQDEAAAEEAEADAAAEAAVGAAQGPEAGMGPAPRVWGRAPDTLAPLPPAMQGAPRRPLSTRPLLLRSASVAPASGMRDLPIFGSPLQQARAPNARPRLRREQSVVMDVL